MPTPHEQKHVKWTNSYTFGGIIQTFGYKYLGKLWKNTQLSPLKIWLEL